MSIRLMDDLWQHGPDSHVDLMVALALADYADEKGKCWPSIASLAGKCRMSERGVRNAIGRLVAGGWLVVQRGGGRSCSNGYLVRISDKPNAARQPTQRTDARPNIPPTVRADQMSEKKEGEAQPVDVDKLLAAFIARQPPLIHNNRNYWHLPRS